jgi:hypothetical protein
MKTVGAFLLFISAVCCQLSAQSQKPSITFNQPDHAIIQAWSEQPNLGGEARIEGDRLILPSDDRDNTCAFMRVYRMKRDVPGSDVTRPAGYTTCVNAARFTMKTSAKPQLLREPTER